MPEPLKCLHDPNPLFDAPVVSLNAISQTLGCANGGELLMPRPLQFFYRRMIDLIFIECEFTWATPGDNGFPQESQGRGVIALVA